jgi:hypothetical protein
VSGSVSWSFEIREPGDGSWRAHQPKFERLVRLPPGGFGMVAKRQTGEWMIVPLGRPPSVDDGGRAAPPKS